MLKHKSSKKSVSHVGERRLKFTERNFPYRGWLFGWFYQSRYAIIAIPWLLWDFRVSHHHDPTISQVTHSAQHQEQLLISFFDFVYWPFCFSDYHPRWKKFYHDFWTQPNTVLSGWGWVCCLKCCQWFGPDNIPLPEGGNVVKIILMLRNCLTRLESDQSDVAILKCI